MLPEPERVPLCRLPTPLTPLARVSSALGVELWAKRDDLTGAALSGNKVRKLEFLLADARSRDADIVLTCGGEQSNHARATALAARELGIDSLLLLRTRDPRQPPTPQGNILLDRLAGATIRWIDHAQYGRRAELLATEAQRLATLGRRPYVIPEGGSNEIGSWGYVRAFAELQADLRALPPVPRTTIVHACGSGGTAAGLVLGAELRDAQVDIVSVNVCDDASYFTRTIGEIIDAFCARYGVEISGAKQRVSMLDGYVGDGYAKSRPEELRALVELARTEALLLDPVYTGKAYFALVSELRRDRDRFGDRVVFLHTGGIFGLFASAPEITQALDPPNN